MTTNTCETINATPVAPFGEPTAGGMAGAPGGKARR